MVVKTERATKLAALFVRAMSNNQHSPLFSVQSACRLKPASATVPAASAKEENKNNNDEKCLGIHDVQPFQCDGSGLGFSTISAFARMHIIWGDAIVPASPRSASSCAGRCFCMPGLMKRNEPRRGPD